MSDISRISGEARPSVERWSLKVRLPVHLYCTLKELYEKVAQGSCWFAGRTAKFRGKYELESTAGACRERVNS